MCTNLTTITMDELLIEAVRDHTVLYDLSHKKYLDTNHKNSIWKKIGEELKVDAHTCKARWNNIRDQYRKTLKRKETTIGKKSKKHYKYSDQLSFLIKYFQDPILNETLGDINFKSELDDSSFCSSNITSNTDPMSYASPPRNGKCISNLMECVLKENEMTPPNHIDAFLAGISPTLKNLTPYYQNLAKSELFAIVQKYEMKMFTDSEQIANFVGDRHDMKTE